MVAIILLIVIFFVGKAYGKNLPPKEVPVPLDPGTGGTSTFDPTALTDRLFRDMDGIQLNIFDRDMDAYNTLNSLSDTDFVKVMNDWDKRYYARSKETLFQAFQGEWFYETAKNLNESLIKRFTRLEATRK